MAQPKNALCSICQQIDFETLYSGKRVQDADRATRSIVLGTYEDIVVRAASRACIFCRWIGENIEFYKVRDPRLQDLGSKKIKLCCDGSTVYDGREMRPQSVSGALIPIVRLRIEPYDIDHDIFADLRLVKLPSSDNPILKALTGEFVARKTTTIEQFRLWLKDCLRTHEHTENDELPKNRIAELQTEALNSIPDFTLIDVARRRLVATKALKHVDRAYIALSYVWGGTAANITLGPDNTLPASLPATIEDAITLVASLESIPFLWIDSICIPQDDLRVRLAQIQKMDVIYSRAVATIIATGANVHSGLTGISVHNNPAQSLKLGPWLITYQPGPWKHMMAGFNNAASFFMPWGSRGWTFQEALMSRRRMILNNADDRIMFECSVRNRQTHPSDVFEQMNAKFFGELDTVRREDMDGWNVHWWQHLLNLYLQRTLSYDRDIISAFTGVAKVITKAVEKKEGEGETCWTIPRREFLAALMWAPTKDSKGIVYREKGLVGEHGEKGKGGVLDDGRRIPSWHWASVVMREGLAFVQGSEPRRLYSATRYCWTRRWVEEEWEELERTGKVEMRGEVVDFEHEGKTERPSSGEKGNTREADQAVVSVLPKIDKLGLEPGTAGLIDHRQCAIEAWRQRKGCFISCSAWEWAGTQEEVNEPLAMYPFAHRMGNPKPMEPNRQFVLMVEWDEETAKAGGVPMKIRGGSVERWEQWRVCRRVGWAVVDLEEWRGRGPVKEMFWLA